MRRLITMVFTCLLMFVGFLLPASPAVSLEQLQVTSAEILAIPDGPPRDDYELIITFNRPLTHSEVTPARFNRYTYGLKYEITSRTGWSEKSWGVSNIQSGLTRNDNRSYWVVGEGSFNPPGRYSHNLEADAAFRKGNIDTVGIELYTQDKKDPDAEWQLVQKFEASDL